MRSALLGAYLVLAVAGCRAGAGSAPKLSQAEAANLIKVVDTANCSNQPILDFNDYGGGVTRAKRYALAVQRMLATHPEFVLVGKDDRSTGQGETAINYTEAYRVDEGGQPVTFTYWVSQGMFGGHHDMMRLSGCLTVPDRIEILDTRIAEGGKDAAVTYRRRYRPSRLVLALAKSDVHYATLIQSSDEHRASLTKLDATGWRVSTIDDNPVTYR